MEKMVASIPNGSLVALGGTFARGLPMALVHELIRQKKRGLRLIGWENSLHLDTLAGCDGVAGEILSPQIGADRYSMNLHRAVEAGGLRHSVHPREVLRKRLEAGADGSGAAILADSMAEGLPGGGYSARITCPFTKKRRTAVSALVPDVALLHLPRADGRGTVQADPRLAASFADDLLMARAAKRTFVTVEQIVSAESVEKASGWTLLQAGAVAEVFYGAHPTSFGRLYREDEAALSEYVRASAGKSQFGAYLARTIAELPSWEAYLKKLGAMPLLELALDRKCV